MNDKTEKQAEPAPIADSDLSDVKGGAAKAFSGKQSFKDGSRDSVVINHEEQWVMKRPGKSVGIVKGDE